MLKLVERKSLSDGVFEQLRDAILSGRLEPGDALPSERNLVAQLGVNRSAVREGLKRLQQLRLIAVRQGGATRVLDFRRTGGLDVLASLTQLADGHLEISVAQSLLEMRTALGPDIARLAARRGGNELADTLETIIERMAKCSHDDAVKLQRFSLQFWRLLVVGSGNIAYQLAFNSMEEGWAPLQDAVAPAMLDEVSDTAGYIALAAAVRSADENRARQVANDMLTRGAASLQRMIELIEPARTLPETSRRHGS